MRLLLVIAALVLAGCGPRMSNLDIVNAVKFCQDNGLKAQSLRNENGEVMDVQCLPEDK